MEILPSVFDPFPASPSTPNMRTAPVFRLPTISDVVAIEAMSVTGISTFCHAAPSDTVSSKLR
jgi:hypothetical protein